MNILVIGPSWVGDMMMSHSLYQQLKQNYPDCQIDVMAPEWCRPLLSLMPEVRTAIAMPIGHGDFKLLERYRLGKALRNQYDMAIVLPNSLKSAFIPLFAKIPLRRGWKGESRYGLLNDLRTGKDRYPLMVQRYVTLAFERNSVPLADHLPIPIPYLSVTSQEIATTVRELHLVQNERSIIGFCPGAEFGPAKRWPHYHYGALAKALIEQGFEIQLFGSAKDYEVGEQIKAELPEHLQPFCINLAGKTTLAQAITLIANCKAIVSNDSGLMHIAAALNRSLVAVYGPTSPQYTPPLSDNVAIIRLIEGGLIKIRKGSEAEGYHQSLVDIKPDLVLDRLSDILVKPL